MNTDHFKQRLLAQEQEIAGRIERAMANAREPDDGTASDTGEEGASSARTDEQLTEAVADSTLLAQVRDALGRIDTGTFGRCLVDGAPIEPKRLEAVPWSPYCLEHQERLEASTSSKPVTL